MALLDRVKEFLSTTSNVSIGQNELKFLSADRLEDGQTGYSVDKQKNSLVTGKPGAWRKEWMVIGTDAMEDPIIVDLRTDDLEVMTAEHGDSDWEPYVIADSLENFKQIVDGLKKLSKDRATLEQLEENPISAAERDKFMAEVEESNPESETGYWFNYVTEE